jgi:hypothetical protein
MHVNAEANLILIKIIDGVKVAKESISDEVEIFVLSWESALVDNEIAFTLITLVEVLLWGDLENIITHLEANGLDLLGNILTW